MALSGPRLAPARGKATHLVVLCHGYGADGGDLIGLAPHLQRKVPGAAFVAPDAPESCPGGGHQWFALSRLDPQELENGVAAAGPLLESFLAGELARLELGADRLALMGFSQGAMLALHVGLTRGCAAIVGFSGSLATRPSAPMPPVLLTHGDSDQVIPPQAMFAAATVLGRAGGTVQWHLAAGVGHGIDPAALDLAGEFLSLAFRGRLQPEAEIACPLR